MRIFILITVLLWQTQLIFGQLLPITDSTTYFPIDFYKRDIMDTYDVESEHLAYHSTILSRFKEPKLFKINHDTLLYRFTWLRSFHSPMVFTLSEQGDEVWLTTKIGNKVNLSNSHYDLSKLSEEEVRRFFTFQQGKIDSAAIQDILKKGILVKDTVKFTYTSTKQKIPREKLQGFEQLLLKEKFWSLTPTDKYIPGFDGSDWIIEAVSPERGYHMVYRWSPNPKSDPPVWRIGRYIIDLTDTDKRRKPIY